MAKTLKTEPVFSSIPKSVSSEALLVWLINLLDSDKKYSQCKPTLFVNILLKMEDKGKPVSEIVVNLQENDMEALLSFHFNGTDEKHDVLLLFGDKISNMARLEQLDRLKRLYPNCNHHIYYKVGYVTSIEEQRVSRNQHELITDGMIEFVLETIEELHLLIKMYTEYLNREGDVVNSYYERIFLKHEKEVLQEPAAQKYLLDSVLECNYDKFWNI